MKPCNRVQNFVPTILHSTAVSKLWYDPLTLFPISSQDAEDEVLIVGNGEVRMRTQGGAEYARMFSHPALSSPAGAPLASALKDRSRLQSLAASDSPKEEYSGEEFLAGVGGGGGGAGGGGSVSGRSSVSGGRGRKSLGSSEGVMVHLQSDRRSKQVRIGGDHSD